MIFGRHYGSGWLQTGLPLYLLLFAIYYFVLYRKQKSKQLVQDIILAACFAIIVELTLFPVAFNQEAINHVIEKHTFSFNLVPLVKGFNAIQNGSKVILVEMGLNVLLFIPLGYVLRRFHGVKRSVAQVVLIGFLISLTIEIIQLISMYQGLNVRIFDIDDLILNTLGTFIGAMLYRKK